MSDCERQSRGRALYLFFPRRRWNYKKKKKRAGRGRAAPAGFKRMCSAQLARLLLGLSFFFLLLLLKFQPQTCAAIGKLLLKVLRRLSGAANQYGSLCERWRRGLCCPNLFLSSLCRPLPRRRAEEEELVVHQKSSLDKLAASPAVRRQNFYFFFLNAKE